MSHQGSDIRLHVSVVLIRKGRLLLVEEAKPENYGKWNLPGGHLEDNETILEGGLREALEETELSVTLTSLLGVYRTHRAGYQAARFVLRAEAKGEPVAGDQILSVCWFSPDEIASLPDSRCVGALKRIAADAFTSQSFPLETLRD
ncbi:MAG: NUDIX domain-containing protein [Armatimonas sp.]